jgi:hypothetical protein
MTKALQRRLAELEKKQTAPLRRRFVWWKQGEPKPQAEPGEQTSPGISRRGRARSRPSRRRLRRRRPEAKRRGGSLPRVMPGGSPFTGDAIGRVTLARERAIQPWDAAKMSG